jgi:hypothetical protein
MSEAKAAQIQDSIHPLAKRRRAAQAKAIRVERTDVKTADVIELRRNGLRAGDRTAAGVQPKVGEQEAA